MGFIIYDKLHVISLNYYSALHIEQSYMLRFTAKALLYVL